MPRPDAKVWSLKTQYGSEVSSYEKHSGQNVHGKSLMLDADLRDSASVCVMCEMFDSYACETTIEG